VQELIAQLEDEAEATRESASARLRVLGPRAIPHLVGALHKGGRRTRLMAVNILEAIPGREALTALLGSLVDPDLEVAGRAVDIVVARSVPEAVSALHAALAEANPALRETMVAGLARLLDSGQVEALEPLLERLTDETEVDAVRLAALEAMEHLPREELRQLLERLGACASPAVAGRARELAGVPDPAGELLHQIERTQDLRELPRMVEALLPLATPAAIPVLHGVLVRLPKAGATVDDAVLAACAGAAHRVLAALGSRIALYDLRERLRARPLRSGRDLLEAAAAIGDGSLLPALAALATDAGEWREALREVLATLVAREHLTRRSAALRGVRPSHRPALDALWPQSPRAPGDEIR
jgi:HEAT repeat protein